MKDKSSKSITGPGLFSLIKNTKLLRKDPLTFGESMLSQYGNAIKIRLGPYQVIALNDPAYHQWVLKDNWTNYPKGKAFEKMDPLMGKGLLMAENEFWRQNRSIVQPAFRLNKMNEYFSEIKESANNLFISWELNRKINFHQEMMSFTLSVISKSLFHIDQGKESHQISEAIHDFMAGMEEHIFYFLPFQKHLPTKINRKFKKSVKYLDSVVYKIIRERRGDSKGKTDLVSMLINASNMHGAQGISDKYLRDEVMNFFVGGHETTANAITWCIFNILSHEQVLEKILEEIGRLNIHSELQLEDLEKCSYLDQVINESLRMFPPIWIISRETKEEDMIDGMVIPKGSIMVVSPYFLHHREDIWPNPHTFDPDRFVESEISKRPKNSFLPFGLGPRSCIGETLARMEIKTFLIMLLSSYRLKLDPEVPVVPYATITLRPKNGLYIQVMEKLK